MSDTRRAFLKQGAAAAAGMLAHDAEAAQAPNILLLFPDELRYDWTGLNRNLNVRTPNLDALAKRGTTFTKAVVASPLCAPSRACLASGREYDRCGVANNSVDYPLDQTTYYSILREHGYHTAGCGKLDLHKKTEFWGLDGSFRLKEWGFSDGIDNAGKMDAIRSGAQKPQDPYMAYLHSKDLAAAHVKDFKSRKGFAATFPTPLPDEAYCDNWVANNGLTLMRRFPKGKPWHMAVNFTGPHPPMDITKAMEKRVRGMNFPQPNRNTEYGPEVHVAIRQNYTAMIENIDRWVGTFIDELKRRGELDNTIIVFSSDHGEMLGDHNKWGKILPYRQSVGVPLVVAGPGVQKGVTSGALVSIMDLASTFLDYGGIRTPKEMDSRSLRPLLEGRTKSHREFVRSGLNKWRMVWDGRYSYVTGFAESGAPILWDHDRDPLENEDFSASDAGQLKRMKAMM